MRDLHLPGRSVAYGCKGAAATSQQLSTMLAIEVLRSGGNAMDAALTASAAQCVIEPHNTGIGGDCFALYWRADQKKLYGYNGAGWAPAGLSDQSLLDQGISTLAPDSIHSVTVPGAVDAWWRLLADHGTRSFADILEPAIDLAENGFMVHERTAADWAEDGEKLQHDPGAREQLLLDGRAPLAGERMRFPVLAKTLRLLAKEGRDAFYQGDIARDLVGFLNAQGGTHTLADFAEFRSNYVDPISTRYRGVDLYQIPPSGQGLTALVLLNILNGFPAPPDPLGADRFHLQIEATQLAYSIRDAFVADPAFAHIPVEELLSDSFTRSLQSRIDLRRAMDPLSTTPSLYQRDTIYLTVADRWGNMCSFINSLYWSFGVGKVSPKTGIALQNREGGGLLGIDSLLDELGAELLLAAVSFHAVGLFVLASGSGFLNGDVFCGGAGGFLSLAFPLGVVLDLLRGPDHLGSLLLVLDLGFDDGEGLLLRQLVVLHDVGQILGDGQTFFRSVDLLAVA